MADSVSSLSGSIFSFEKLDDNNYPLWKEHMASTLILKDLWEAVDPGLSEKPTKAELVCDRKAYALIKLAVSSHIVSMVIDSSTASEAWETLETIYQTKSKARCMQLRNELTTMRLTQHSSITAYFSRGLAIQRDLAAGGSCISTEDLIMAILNGLPSYYRTVKTILLKDMTTTSLSISDVQALLEQEQASVEKEEGETNHQSAFMARADSRSCFFCKAPGHIKSACRKYKAYIKQQEPREHVATLSFAM
jgi:hypothetical protein